MTGADQADQSVQDAARLVFVGSAPERANDLQRMWADLAPVFQRAEDNDREGRMILDAGLYRYVRFNHRAMRAFWIAGYAAWEAYRLVAEVPDLQMLDTTRFVALVTAFEQVIESEAPELEPLPAGVAEPGTYTDIITDPQGRAAAELATIGVAWALLHELHHITLQQKGTSDNHVAPNRAKSHKEELSCDEFATAFLLEQIEEYALQKAVSVEAVRQKRQLGIYFGLFALTMLAKNSWQASDSHPSVQDRIDAVRMQMQPRSDLSAAFAHIAFTTLGRLWPGAPNPYRLAPQS